MPCHAREKDTSEAWVDAGLTALAEDDRTPSGLRAGSSLGVTKGGFYRSSPIATR